MDDETLSRMAIEEIVREMNEARQRELHIPQERKLNPLGKPNKRFLGRTINSVLTHNKRQNDIKRENCRRKLRDLDDRARRRLKNEYFNKEVKERWSRTRSKSRSSRVTFSSSRSSSSSSSSDESQKRKKKKKLNSKKKKTKSMRKSSRSFTDGNNQKEQSHRRRYQDYAEEEKEKEEQQQQEQYNVFHIHDYYAKANLHYANIAVAYNQMNQLYQYSSILASAVNMNKNAVTSPPNTTNSSSRKSSRSKSPIISPTCSPTSTSTSLSISLSSLDEDENGVLTINVSSDNEDSTVKPLKNRLENVNDSTEALILSASSDSSDSDGNICINLETESANEDSDSSAAIFSCFSVSEKNCEEAVPLITGKSPGSDSPKTMIDLTEE